VDCSDATELVSQPSFETFSSPLPESNRRPHPYHGCALPTELRGRMLDHGDQLSLSHNRLVGPVDTSYGVRCHSEPRGAEHSPGVSPSFTTSTGTPARRADATQWAVPLELSTLNPTHRSAPEATMVALRIMPARLP
jgi:hypothetical protein